MELIVRHRGREEKVHLEPTESGYRVHVGERRYDVDVAVADGGIHSLLIGGCQHEVTARRQRDGLYWVASVCKKGLPPLLCVRNTI